MTETEIFSVKEYSDKNFLVHYNHETLEVAPIDRIVGCRIIIRPEGKNILIDLPVEKLICKDSDAHGECWRNGLFNGIDKLFSGEFPIFASRNIGQGYRVLSDRLVYLLGENVAVQINHFDRFSLSCYGLYRGKEMPVRLTQLAEEMIGLTNLKEYYGKGYGKKDK